MNQLTRPGPLGIPNIVWLGAAVYIGYRVINREMYDSHGESFKCCAATTKDTYYGVGMFGDVKPCAAGQYEVPVCRDGSNPRDYVPCIWHDSYTVGANTYPGYWDTREGKADDC